MIVSRVSDYYNGYGGHCGSSITAFVISRLIVNRIHPNLIKERSRFMQAKDTKLWDKLLAPLLGFGSIMILVVA